MDSKTLYLIAGSSGLIGMHVCKALKESNNNFLGVDFKSGEFSEIIDLSDQTKFLEVIEGRITPDITHLSFIFSAGKNGSVEHGGLDSYGSYCPDELQEYLLQNTILPYSCSMSLITLAKKKNLNLKILILCSHYSFVAGSDSLYSDSSSGEKQIKPHGYIISKHAAVGVVKSLASSYGSDQILVNGFAPGGVFNHQDKEFLKKFETYSPLKRMAEPIEIAQWIVTLSDPRLTYANGSIFNIDGGVLIR
jgi:nucleoside-diphosphate-sugar epimerase